MILTSTFVALLAVIPQGDAQAKAIYDAWQTRLKTVQAVSGKLQVKFQPGQPPETWEFVLVRPGKFRVATKTQEFISSGEKSFVLLPTDKEYITMPMPVPPVVNGFENIFGSRPEKQAPTEFTFGDYEGKRVAIAIYKPTKDVSIETLLDPQSKQPIAWRQSSGLHSLSGSYSDVKLDGVTVSDSAFALPAGYSERQQPDYMAKLLKVGTQAPDFKLKKSDGGETTLKDELKGRKAVLLNFWFYG